jgi:hypothetical protein
MSLIGVGWRYVAPTAAIVILPSLDLGFSNNYFKGNFTGRLLFAVFEFLQRYKLQANTNCSYPHTFSGTHPANPPGLPTPYLAPTGLLA